MSETVWLIMGVALIIYVVTGGADFGGGVWDLLARGASKKTDREAIENAIAPIWEANHVWLIFIIVVMFTAFPRAFSVASIAFHIPLTLVLVGIVLRGASFVFRAYGMNPDPLRATYGRVFAWSSAMTPVFLGLVLAGMSSGAVVVEAGIVRSGFFVGWTTLYAIAVGILALVLFCLLAAVYMTLEGPTDVAERFRKRAIACELACAPVAALTFFAARRDAPLLAERLSGHPGFWPIQLLCALLGAATILALVRRRYPWARVTVIGQVVFVVVGWGLAMRGELVLGAVSLDNAGTNVRTLPLLLTAIAAGAALLLPSLYLLMHIFKSNRR